MCSYHQVKKAIKASHYQKKLYTSTGHHTRIPIGVSLPRYSLPRIFGAAVLCRLLQEIFDSPSCSLTATAYPFPHRAPAGTSIYSRVCLAAIKSKRLREDLTKIEHERTDAREMQQKIDSLTKQAAGEHRANEILESEVRFSIFMGKEPAPPALNQRLNRLGTSRLCSQLPCICARLRF